MKNTQNYNFLLLIFLLLSFLNFNEALAQKGKRDEDGYAIEYFKRKPVNGKISIYSREAGTYKGVNGNRKIYHEWYYSIDGGDKIKFTSFKDESLKALLTSEEASNAEYQKMKKNRFIRWGAFIGFPVLGITLASSGGVSQDIGAIIAVGGAIGALCLIKDRSHFFYRAVTKYNEIHAKKTSFLIPLKPDYLKIGNAQNTLGVSIGWHLGTN